ncbi:MAG: FkbM family methyltransferase [Gammaproteobacteria bacterium]
MQKHKSSTVSHVAGFSYVRQRLLMNLLSWLGRTNTKKQYPRLVCMPTDYIGQQIILNGLYEEHILNTLFNDVFLEYIPRFSATMAVDVGANIGNHTCYFSRYFKKVIAFEPNPVAHKILETNISINAINNADIFAAGLSDVNEEIKFRGDRDGNLGGSRFLRATDEPRGDEITLPVLSGDDFITRYYATEQISLIKLDIEGHEFRALQGLRETLIKHNPIILFETHGTAGEFGSIAILKFLSEQGYRHFYAIESSQPLWVKSFLSRVLYRLFVGVNYVCYEITTPENRAYSLIVGSSTDLKISR